MSQDHAIDYTALHSIYEQIQHMQDQLNALKRTLVAAVPNDQGQRDQLAFAKEFPTLIYHITPKAYFEQFAADQPYVPQQYEQDGFIHCTRGADFMVMIANKHYRHTSGEYVMLAIDPAKLRSKLVYEALDATVLIPFPHIYGAINLDAVLEVIPMPRDAQGRFLLPH